MGEKFSIYEEDPKKERRAALAPHPEKRFMDPTSPEFAGGFVLGIEAALRLAELPLAKEARVRSRLKSMLDKEWNNREVYASIVEIFKETTFL